MSQISAADDNLTLINTFTVDPAKADELIDLLNLATETVMRHQPGFVSANIHRAVDGRRVVNYAQWRSKADFEAMQADPEAREHMRRAGQLALDVNPVFYTVASVYDG